MLKSELENEIKRLKDTCNEQLDRINTFRDQTKRISGLEEYNKDLKSDIDIRVKQLSDIALIASTFINVNYPPEFIYNEFGRNEKNSTNKDKRLLMSIIDLTRTPTKNDNSFNYKGIGF